MSTTRELTAANSGSSGGSVRYDTDGADTHGADPATGFQTLTPAPANPNFFMPEGSNGDTYVGDPLTPPHGFLSRPHGWER